MMPGGNVSQIDDAISYIEKDFSYDSLSRLTYWEMSIGIPPVPVDWEAYTYSPVTGNMDSKDGVDYTYPAQTPGSCPGGSRSIPHTVSSIDTPRTYTYDCNGNMTSRILDGMYPPVYNFSYDAENRLTAVSGEATAAFVYDGDDNRVKASLTQGSTTTKRLTSAATTNGS